MPLFRFISPTILGIALLFSACLTDEAADNETVIVQHADDKSAPPKSIWAEVKKQYPDASPDEWYREPDSSTVIQFYTENAKGVANFDEKGKIQLLELDMNPKLMPALILNGLTQQFPDGNLGLYTLTIVGGVKKHNIELTDGDKYYSFVYDDNNQQISKIVDRLDDEQQNDLLDRGYESPEDSL